MDAYSRWGKRALDIAVVALTLPATLPALLAVATVTRALIGSPVLFRQQRPGLNGQPFTLLKFRTMGNGTNHAGEPLPDAERLARFGRLLRSLSLDELPQIWNVLRGEMSLVGPRPLLMSYLGRYSPRQARRHEIRPGITGWAQVNGRNELSWEDKFDHDVWYVDHVSFPLDVKILIRTLWKAPYREGIAQPGLATMAEFQGTAEKTEPQARG